MLLLIGAVAIASATFAERAIWPRRECTYSAEWPPALDRVSPGGILGSQRRKRAYDMSRNGFLAAATAVDPVEKKQLRLIFLAMLAPVQAPPQSPKISDMQTPLISGSAEFLEDDFGPMPAGSPIVTAMIGLLDISDESHRNDRFYYPRLRRR